MALQAREIGRIVVPLSGVDGDAALLARAAEVAARFDAELAAVFAPPDPTELTPWLGEGFVGGVQAAAVESLKDAADQAEAVARAAFGACPGPRKRFVALAPPVWRGLAAECRLADLVVFDGLTARGGAALSGPFEQILMEERAAALVLRGEADPFGAAVVAWDGGEPASRAARRATPLLRRCARVLVVGVEVGEHAPPLQALIDYYAARGVAAEARTLLRGDDIAGTLLATCEGEAAGLLVAGAFGRSRLREFIFGGTTRALIGAERPSLFTAH